MNAPSSLPVDPNGIPAELKPLRQWIGWKYRYDPKRKKWRKVPKNPHTGGNASPTAPSTWGTFDQAHQRMLDDDLDGVGCVFTSGDPFVGIDFDDVVTDGVIAPHARKFLPRFPTYVELSPSGTGLHLILKSPILPQGWIKKNGFEVFWQDHYLTMTGLPLPGPKHITDCTQELLAWRAEVAAATSTLPCATKNSRPVPTSGATAVDQALLARCRERWARFGPLYDDGDLSDYADDHSSADLALLTYLAHAGVGTAEELERFFSNSALDREKWRERPDYRQRTIAVAMNGATPPDSSTVNDPDQLRRRIADLERERETFADRLVQNSILISQNSQIRGNAGLREARVAQTLVAKFIYCERTGATRPYRISINEVARASGVHRNTASRHIGKFKAAGFMEVTQRPEPGPIDPETGVISPPRTVTYLAPRGSALEFAAAVATVDLRQPRDEPQHMRLGAARNIGAGKSPASVVEVKPELSSPPAGSSEGEERPTPTPDCRNRWVMGRGADASGPDILFLLPGLCRRTA